MIAEPPFDSGAVKVTRNAPSSGATAEITGTPGVVIGVALREFDAAPLPAAFTARIEIE